MADDALQAAQAAAADAARAAAQAQRSAQGATENAVNSATEAADNMAASAQQSALRAEDAALSAAQSAQDAGTNAARQAQEAAQNASQQAQEAAEQAQAGAQQAQAAAENAARESQAAADEAVRQADQAAQQAQQAVAQAEQAAEASQEAQQVAAQAQQAAQEAQQAAQRAVEEGTPEAQQAAAEAQVAAEEAAQQAQAAAAQAQVRAEQAAQQAQETAEAAQIAAEEAAQQAGEAAQQAVEAAQQAAQPGSQAVQQAAQLAQEAAQQATQAAQSGAQASQQATQQANQTAAAAGQGGVTTAVADLQDTPDVVPPELTPERVGAGATGYQYKIKIGGTEVSTELVDRIVEVSVDDSLYMPDMFVIEIDDSNQEWVDAEMFDVGAEVEIMATVIDENAKVAVKNLLIKGEITALEPEFTQTGDRFLVIRGYNYSYLLQRDRKSRSFLNTTDSEIADKIAQQAGLRSETDPTSVVYDYVFQNNQTDLEFLVARAQRIGYQFYVEDKTVYFKKYAKGQGESPELAMGDNLLTFRPRLTIVRQVNEVIVRGWDPGTKAELVGRASSGEGAPEIGVSQTGAELAKKAFGNSAETVVVNRHVTTLDEANSLAQAVYNEMNSDFVQAEGMCLGDPRVQAGQTIEITGVGERFGGSYFVTSAEHIFNSDGYQTRFTISGRHPDTLTHLLEHQNGNGDSRGALGVVIGLVTHNKDPEDLGRVKVKYPWLAETEESHWIRVAQNGGVYNLPDINQEVLVAFEHGDIHAPYVLGMLWNGKDRPTKSTRDVLDNENKVVQRSIRSNGGHEIILDDRRGQEKIVIRDKSGNNEIVIDAAHDSMSLKVRGNLSIEAQGDVNIKGRTINLN